MNIDSLKNILKIDKKGMFDLLVSFPNQCVYALLIGEHTPIKKSFRRKYSNIVFTGLGGSAIGADIIKGFTEEEIDIPLIVNRNYTLPQFVGKDTLLFAVSYSGKTEETLAAYLEAKKRGVNAVVITSGGKLAKLASKNKDILIEIPEGYPPRCALGYSFIPALVLLGKLGIIKNKKKEIKKAIHLLYSLQKKNLNPHIKKNANISKSTAEKIYKRFPVIYSSSRMESIAKRWRGQLAENSKTLASHHVFPEMNHNEIVGWDNPDKLLKGSTVIMLKDKGDLPQIKKRMKITSSILKKENFNVLEIESRGTSLLERMLSLVYIGDFMSFYLAVMNKIDPTPVDRIAYLKRELAK